MRDAEVPPTPKQEQVQIVTEQMFMLNQLDEINLKLTILMNKFDALENKINSSEYFKK